MVHLACTADSCLVISFQVVSMVHIHKFKLLSACFRELIKSLQKLSCIIEDPYYEARELLMFLKGVNLETLMLNLDNLKVLPSELNALNTLVARRTSGEPLAYIVNSKEFFQSRFYVNHDVLIPRPDTEILVESILANHCGHSGISILDIGTGSGCIIISLMNAIADSAGTATDISNKALSVCRRNAISHGLLDKLVFIKSNWLDNLPRCKYDVIVANPPYIASSEHELMSRDTLFEPAIALYSKNGGTNGYFNIDSKVSEYMHSDTRLYIEIGINKKSTIIDIFEKFGLKCAKDYKDFSGHPRCLQFHR